MSGLKPFFITGANAKIKLNGKTMAFCTDFSYSVQVITKTPKVLGMYEGTSVEPLGYNVSGSFTVIRYAKDAVSNIGSSPNNIATNDAGNGVGNWGSQWGGTLGDFLSRNGVGNDGRANEALNPSKFGNGVTFDIQVYQKIPTAGNNSQAVEAQIGRTIQEIQGALTGNNLEQNDVLGVANIRGCRISQADFSITKKGAAMQKFNFVALYVDEDSFVADFSGTGQQF
jgi:hypothetical protein